MSAPNNGDLAGGGAAGLARDQRATSKGPARDEPATGEGVGGTLLPWGQAAMREAILVLTTCASLMEGESIAKHLLEQKLVACANLGNHMHSYFVWHGQAQEATEYPLLLKTLRERFGEVEAEIRKLHSYENPEIIAVPIVAASAAYLDWIAAGVAATPPAPGEPES
jgi:periplasmic divalent cation tolerance protein